MMAIELEASIVDHRVEIVSDRLPAHRVNARVIVLYDEEGEMSHRSTNRNQALFELLANPYPPKGDGLPMKREELYDRTGLR